MAKGRRQPSNQYPSRHSTPIKIRPSIRFLIPMILAGVLVGFGYWGWRQLMKPDTLPIKHIDIVSKDVHLNASGLQKVAWKNLQGGFFSLKVKKLKQALLDLPWVADVSLRRHWPSSLQIMVTEQQPIARWNSNAVINSQGDLFYPSPKTIPKTLPLLKGPIGDEKKIVINFQKVKDFANLQGLSIASIEVSPRLSYRVVLNNGVVVVIGRQDIVQRFNHFINFYPRLHERRNKHISRVDLRYQNGFAIKWQKKR